MSQADLLSLLRQINDSEALQQLVATEKRCLWCYRPGTDARCQACVRGSRRQPFTFPFIM